MKENHQPYGSIITEACTWIGRLETGEFSVTELAEFREWMQRSPRHGAEFKRLARLSMDMERLKLPLQKTDVDVDVLPIEDIPMGSRWPFIVRGIAGLAAVLLVAVSLVLWQFGANGTNGLLTTPVGGYLEKKLSDGTVIRLNTDSRLTVAYDNAHRAIHLQRGEVYFEVVHDDDRPFVVHTGIREVFALGTAFVVRLHDGLIRVMVTEGQVAVSQHLNEIQQVPGVAGEAPTAPAPSAAPILLQAGQNFEDSQKSAQPVTEVAAPEVQRRLAWQRGLIEFTDTPLDEVVVEVSRYTNLTILIDGVELRDVRFGGMFPTGDIDRLFGVLESAYGITAAYADESTVVLTSKR